MSASDNLHPQQLKMFMTGKELRDSMSYSYDLDPGETMDDMWDRKVDESMSEFGGESWDNSSSEGSSSREHGAGVYDSLKNEGLWDTPSSVVRVRHHVNKDSMRLRDAHHRVASAAHIEESGGRQIFFPVSHELDVDPFLNQPYAHSSYGRLQSFDPNAVGSVPRTSELTNSALMNMIFPQSKTKNNT